MKQFQGQTLLVLCRARHGMKNMRHEGCRIVKAAASHDPHLRVYGAHCLLQSDLVQARLPLQLPEGLRKALHRR